VRAYLSLLRGADRVGFARRADETASEFEAALAEPRGPLAETTAVFESARYGAAELTDDDVARAERGAAAVLEHLARHPPPRRSKPVRDAAVSSTASRSRSGPLDGAC
jgi:hypothetical protein